MPPSKKNSKVVFCRGKFPTVLPSKAYSKWHKETASYLGGEKPIKGWNLSFDYNFKIPYNKDWSISGRPFDFSNKIESINDFLVDSWIIEDDNYLIISEIKIKYQFVEYWKWEVIVNIKQK